MKSEARGFVRQGAWMVAASLSGGLAMMLVHTWVSKACGGAAYAEFKTLLSTFYAVAAVGGGLWLSFGQRTAAAVTEEEVAAVAWSARQTLGAIGLAWVGLAVVLWMVQGRLMEAWKLSGTSGLWATWLLGLLTLWLSVLRGVVQGRQSFGTLGGVAILDGVGRLVAVLVLVTWWRATATGAVMGAVAGSAMAMGAAAWGARDVLARRGGGSAGVGWAGAAVLALQAAALQVFQQYDNLFWASAIPGSALEAWSLGTSYSPAHTVGFGITQFTVPLVLVMLPRVARASALGEGSDTLRLTLWCTAGMGGLAALACTVAPRLPLQVMFFNNPTNWAAAPLVPWFAWGMVLFTLSNVVLNDLVARGKVQVAWLVMVVAVGYVAALGWLRAGWVMLPPMEAYRSGVQVLCAATATLLVGSALARWGLLSRPPSRDAGKAAPQ